jgi:hypothetical protein
MGALQRSDTEGMNYPDSISLRRSNRLPRYALWVFLLLSSGIPRILAAFLLPNEEGDPYSYLQAIEIMRASIAGGTFTLSELFGFWLPLYQFICALISVVVGHPLYVAKLVSALCGTGVCLLVFQVSMQLTANRMLALLAFALIALNPIHIMYSSFSMSDVPHALMVLGSLYFAIKNRWVLAASLVAAGGLMRPESWLFVALLPALQWFLHRRVSLIAFFVALSAPVVWIYISWAATGDPLEYFKVRNDYIRELLSGNPGLADFSPSHVLTDLRTLFYSAGPAVMIACLMAAWLLIKHTHREPNERSLESSSAVVVTVAYFFSSLGFLLLAYFTKNQPAIFARYCLVLFAFGLPVLAWTLLAAREWTRAWALRLSVLLVALCLWQLAFQLRDGAFFINHVSQKRIVAKYLRDKFQSSSRLKIFCDDDTVKVLAGIPADSFVSSSGSPGDSKSFLGYLRENRVEYLVYERRDRSAVVTLFRDLGEERINDLFQLVASTNVDLRLYRTIFQ